MILRHPFIIWKEVRIGYYMLPVTVIILLFSLFVTGEMIRYYKGAEKMLTICLFLLVGLNITALPRYYRLIRYSYDGSDRWLYSRKINQCVVFSQEINQFQLGEDEERYCRALK